jgi:hypothetical protein
VCVCACVLWARVSRVRGLRVSSAPEVEGPHLESKRLADGRGPQRHGAPGPRPVLLDVVDREQMLDEAGLDARPVGAVLAGEVGLAQVRGPGVHLTATRTYVKSWSDDREERRLWKIQGEHGSPTLVPAAGSSSRPMAYSARTHLPHTLPSTLHPPPTQPPNRPTAQPQTAFSPSQNDLERSLAAMRKNRSAALAKQREPTDELLYFSFSCFALSSATRRLPANWIIDSLSLRDLC